ncbi:MAG: L,D-transpeptidase family protein [Rhodospirillales bacterium]
MGSRALYLGWSSYLIHGTNRCSIGRRGGRGCIRMYEDDVRALYDHAAVGTQVTTLDQPVKVGWIGDQLYIEASPTIAQVRQWEEDKRFDPVSDADVRDLVLRKASKSADLIDWAAVDRVVGSAASSPVSPVRKGRSPSPAPHLRCPRRDRRARRSRRRQPPSPRQRRSRRAGLSSPAPAGAASGPALRVMSW